MSLHCIQINPPSSFQCIPQNTLHHHEIRSTIHVERQQEWGERKLNERNEIRQTKYFVSTNKHTTRCSRHGGQDSPRKSSVLSRFKLFPEERMADLVAEEIRSSSRPKKSFGKCLKNTETFYEQILFMTFVSGKFFEYLCDLRHWLGLMC
jgi:hypothetical protein